jgi:hypothetical protein
MRRLLFHFAGSALLIVSAFTSFSQPIATLSNDYKKIADLFPDDQFFAADEKVNYNFSLVPSGKKSVFSIKEKYSGGFFTSEQNYTKVNSVFYDDASAVTGLTCFINNISAQSFPVLRSNYESEGIFHDDMKVCAYKLDMTKGKTYRVSYTKDYNNPRLFSKVYFHENYPIHKKTISFEIPEWVDVEIKPINFEGFTISQQETTLVVAGKKVKKITYEMENVGAIPNEVHSQNPAKYLPHMLVFVKSYTGKKQSEKYFSTHDDIYKWVKVLVDSVDNDTAALRPVVKDIVKNETDSFKIMERIFYWVQEHVRYIAFEDGIMGYKPMPAIKVYNMLYGDCKGMANLTKNLLKVAGFDARLTWIGTNDIPYKNDLPCLAVYNHMICTAFFRGKKYFLDATEDYIAIDDYAERIQGRPVMIENGSAYIVDNIPYFGCERNKKECSIEYTLENGKLKGTQTLVCDGEQKTYILRSISALKMENKERAINNYLKSDNDDMNVTSFTMSDIADRVKPLEIKCSFEKENSVYADAPGKMLVFLEKDYDFENLEFDSLRKNDYEFNNRYFITSTSTINLPPNYSMLKAPADVDIKNDDYEFQLKYEYSGKTIKLVKNIKIKNNILKKSQFDQWNAGLKKLKNFYHSPLILKTS